MAKFDSKALSKNDWAVVGAAGIAFISLFLPWYGVSLGLISVSATGWSSGYGLLGALLMIASGAYLLAQRSQVNLSKMRLGPGIAVLAAATAGTLLVVLRWLTLPSGLGPRVGIILTLLAGLVQVFFALKLFRASGETLPWDSAAAKKDAPPASSAD